MRPSDYVKKGWTKGFLARNSNGMSRSPNDPDAICWCMIGAICKATTNDAEVNKFLKCTYNVLKKRGIRSPVDAYNDTVGRTRDEVLSVLEEAEKEYYETKS